MTDILQKLTGKTVLVTGGTGSFGRAMVNRLLETDAGEIRIFSRDELKQELMRIEYKEPRLNFYIGDVRERESVDNVMNGVDYVFHAAALKQVPSCEFFPIQAVYTNILGGYNVIESAIAHKVKTVVCLSTDKAAYPINAMGMTKALLEKVAQAAARTKACNSTVVCCVRYGNVMYSRGSVIPLFVQQIKEGRPLTLTEPTMTRFLMPLRDSVDLVLFAFENARPGDLFVKKAAASTVNDLAQAIKNLFEAQVEIKVIGVRHGEKMFETLVTKEELRRSEDMGDYYRISLDDRNLNYNLYFTEGDRKEAMLDDYHSHNTQRLNVRQVEELLLSLPEIREELRTWKAEGK
ncbi:MAG TPA: polysaccharide biosynthesis protein [Sedimentisphaerales bacterium]|nr:polysaccharide biosynthesis protein [Sedimentisphaerales bacterium]